MVTPYIPGPPGPIQPETYRELQRISDDSVRDRERLVDLFAFILENYAFAAHGTMFNAAPVVGPDIPAGGWQIVTVFDTVASARGITFDTAANTWTYTVSGVYQVSIELVLLHGESNAGRTFRIRLNNGVDTPGDGVPVAVGRNQPGSNVAISFLQDIQPDNPNRTYRIEVGGGDAITGVTWEAASPTIVNVGAWLDETPT